MLVNDSDATYSKGYTASIVRCFSSLVPSRKFTDAVGLSILSASRCSNDIQIEHTPYAPAPCRESYG